MSDSRPNLVFVFPDQMRGSAMGFTGEEPVLTPRLDAFAKESRYLPDAASNFPVCSPYRGMLMTGQYPFRNGVLGNCNNKTEPLGYELKTDARCWSDVLAEEGYSLGYLGKWHLDSPHAPYVETSNNRGDTKWNEWCPPERRHGFDFWYAYGTYDGHLRPLYWTKDAPRDGFEYVDQWGPEHEADMAIRYFENEGETYRDPSKPFALVVSMNPPHTPYDKVPDRYKVLYQDLDVEETCRKRPSIPPDGTPNGDLWRSSIRDYYAMISGVDEQFGRILDALEASGLAENTIVVFTSDHGDCIGAHDFQHKPAQWEEAFRVPFLIRWPKQIPQGTDPLLISTPDIYPTLLGLLGAADKIPAEVEGTDWSDTLRGQSEERPSEQFYVRPNAHYPKGGSRGIRTNRHTYVVAKATGTTVPQAEPVEIPPDLPTQISLFDRVSDPCQLTDIADDPGQADLVAALHARLEHWLQRTDDPWAS